MYTFDKGLFADKSKYFKTFSDMFVNHFGDTDNSPMLTKMAFDEIKNWGTIDKHRREYQDILNILFESDKEIINIEEEVGYKRLTYVLESKDGEQVVINISGFDNSYPEFSFKGEISEKTKDKVRNIIKEAISIKSIKNQF